MATFMLLLRAGASPVTFAWKTRPLVLVLAVISACVSTGCTTPRVEPQNARTPAGVVCDYDVQVDSELVLTVVATFAAPLLGELALDDPAMPFVEAVTVIGAAGRAPAARGKSGYAVSCASSCRVEYRFRLRDAAARIADVDTAIALGAMIVAPPSTWLLRPWDASEGRYRFHVATPAGVGFASGVRPSLARAGAYEGDLASIGESAFSAFGGLTMLAVAPGIDAAVAGGVELAHDDVLPWLRAELTAIRAYYESELDDRIVVLVAPGNSDVIRGKTLGGGGASVLVRLGTTTTTADLAADWVVAHELVHVGFPALGYEHGWFSEGLATYVEPVARARRGLVSVEQVWSDLVENAPQGLPAKGDTGLEGTDAWGRVYWGGALYFLLADLTIREQTRGRRSLDDALRAVAATGANVETRWTLEKVLDVGDRATGTRVLHDLHVRFGTSPGTVDLPALWARLGVRRSAAPPPSIEFDDAAPAAHFRKAITAANPVESPVRIEKHAE